MAKMSFSSANKSADRETFPKLTFDQDESGRIACYEEPEVGFVHNIRAPKIVNGEVQYKQVRAKDGSVSRQMDYEFINNPICLGDFNELLERGIDPKRCPACKAAQEAPDMFSPPKRRFAMHVFQYQTNGTTKATKNFQGAVKVWAFTDQKFNELIDLMDEAPNGDLKNIDVIITCENKLYQNFKMIHSNQVKWQESDQSRAQFEEIVADNKVQDITRFLGRTTKKDWLEDDLEKVRSRWKVANGQKDEKPNDDLAGAERNLDAGLSGLLDEPKATPASDDSKPAVASAGSDDDGPVDFDKLLNDL